MYFFISDEHFGHEKIIEHANRPFSSIEEMDRDLIDRFNSLVWKNDITVHAGDFCWLSKKEEIYKKYVRRLNGNHIFLVGSHDHWLPDSTKYIWRKRIEGVLVIVCHYAMLTWESSHYNSWQLFGHSHGRLSLKGKQHDIGVDNNDYFPVSFKQLKKIMGTKEDNWNYLEKKEI